jgi:hypothetical protein
MFYKFKSKQKSKTATATATAECLKRYCFDIRALLFYSVLAGVAMPTLPIYAQQVNANQNYAANALEVKKIIYIPKKGIKSTQTPFGALAVTNEAKTIQIVNLEEDCNFGQELFQFPFKEPIRFVIKNNNNYPVRLIFAPLDSSDQNKNKSPYKLTPMPVSKKQSHVINIAENGRYVLNWFFNRKKYFKWVCVNEKNDVLSTADMQVGNASKLNKKQRQEVKKMKKYKPLPPPPPGFDLKP